MDESDRVKEAEGNRCKQCDLMMMMMIIYIYIYIYIRGTHDKVPYVFHIKAPRRKKSGNLLNDSRIFLNQFYFKKFTYRACLTPN